MQAKHIFFNILIAITGMFIIIYSFNKKALNQDIETSVTDTILNPAKINSINKQIQTTKKLNSLNNKI